MSLPRGCLSEATFALIMEMPATASLSYSGAALNGPLLVTRSVEHQVALRCPAEDAFRMLPFDLTGKAFNRPGMPFDSIDALQETGALLLGDHLVARALLRVGMALASFQVASVQQLHHHLVVDGSGLAQIICMVF